MDKDYTLTFADGNTMTVFETPVFFKEKGTDKLVRMTREFTLYKNRIKFINYKYVVNIVVDNDNYPKCCYQITVDDPGYPMRYEDFMERFDPYDGK